MVDDAGVLVHLTDGLNRQRHLSGHEHLAYTARVVGVGDGQVDLELAQGGATARTWIALPESLRPQPWLTNQEPGDGPEEWVGRLAEWLDEEMDTGGLGPAYARVVLDRGPRLVVDGYGFRRADEVEHRRLRRSVGPHGWSGSGGRRLARRQYAAEWALDQVEQQIRTGGEAVQGGDKELESSLTSPDRLSIYVEATAAPQAGKTPQLLLTAWMGMRGGPLARRRITTVF